MENETKLACEYHHKPEEIAAIIAGSSSENFSGKTNVRIRIRIASTVRTIKTVNNATTLVRRNSPLPIDSPYGINFKNILYQLKD